MEETALVLGVSPTTVKREWTVARGWLHRALIYGARVGGWRILRPLGRGGMGTVYLAARAEAGFTQRAALKSRAADSPTT